MSVFRDDEQRDRVIRTLLGRDLLSRLHATRLGALVADGPLSADDAALVALTNGLLGIGVVVYVRDVVLLPPEALMRVGSLLVAIADGPGDVDEWIDMLKGQ